MTPEQFCYWLQGFAEMNGKAPDEAQWKMLRDHLQTVFTKVTPSLQYQQFPPLTPPAIC